MMEPFGLPERQTARILSAVGIAKPPYRGCPPWPALPRLPCRDCLIREPDGQAAPWPQSRIMLRPLRDPRSWNMRTMLGVRLERHGRQLAVVKEAPAYPIKPSPAITAKPRNNVTSAPPAARRTIGNDGAKCIMPACKL